MADVGVYIAIILATLSVIYIVFKIMSVELLLIDVEHRKVYSMSGIYDGKTFYGLFSRAKLEGRNILRYGNVIVCVGQVVKSRFFGFYKEFASTVDISEDFSDFESVLRLVNAVELAYTEMIKKLWDALVKSRESMVDALGHTINGLDRLLKKAGIDRAMVFELINRERNATYRIFGFNPSEILNRIQGGETSE